MNYHSFHLVDPSPWPIFGAASAFIVTSGGVLYMHSYVSGLLVLFLGIYMIGYTMFYWWRDVVREGTMEGHHTKPVQHGLRYGMILFIASEVMFFFSFFWSFFASSLSPTIQIGATWPPLGIEVLNPFEIPLLNTAILLLSGASVTWCHYALTSNDRQGSIVSLIITICLAIAFTSFQVFEYFDASFSIDDGIYGSTFYMATGFHGFHVIIGTSFLIVCLYRLFNYHFTNEHHFGFEAAAWYWQCGFSKSFAY